MSELEEIKEEELCLSATEIVENLIRIENETAAGKSERLDSLHTILHPLCDEASIQIGRIDILKPHDKDVVEPNRYKDFEKARDISDDSIVYNSPYGRIAVKRLTYGSRYEMGYNFHIYASNKTNFALIGNYLSFRYNSERSDSPLWEKNIKHREQFVKEDKTVVHSFSDSRLKYKVILHTEADFHPLEPIIQENKKGSLDLSQQKFELVEFDINKFPLTEKEFRESQDPKQALEMFLKSTLSLLRLENYKLEYNEKIIFQNKPSNKKYRVFELNPFKISYTGIENFEGINLFFNLLKARILYPFEIEFLEIIAHKDKGDKEIVESLQLTQTKEQKENLNLRDMYTSPYGIKIKMMRKNPQKSQNKGRMHWYIVVPNNYAENIKNLLKSSDGVDQQLDDLYGFVIKSTRPGQYSHVVNARRAERV